MVLLYREKGILAIFLVFLSYIIYVLYLSKQAKFNRKKAPHAFSRNIMKSFFDYSFMLLLVFPFVFFHKPAKS